MKQARKDLTVEGAATVSQVAEYLEQLAQALRTGAVHVQHGDQELVLGPRGVLGLEVRARQRGKRQRLALELTWRRKLLVPDLASALRFAAGPASEASEASEATAEAMAVDVITTTAEPVERGEAREGEALDPAEIYLRQPTDGDAPQ